MKHRNIGLAMLVRISTATNEFASFCIRVYSRLRKMAFSCLQKWAGAGFQVMLKHFEIKKGFIYVTVRLFGNRSQKTSKFGKNIIDTLGYRLACTFFF